MSSFCSAVFLNEPYQVDLEAMNNALLTLSIDEFTNSAKTIPLNLTGYTARGALKLQAGGPVIPLATTITQTSTNTNVTGILIKSTVEGLAAATPYIYDISIDNPTTGDSKVLWTGIITFQAGAST